MIRVLVHRGGGCVRFAVYSFAFFLAMYLRYRCKLPDNAVRQADHITRRDHSAIWKNKCVFIAHTRFVRPGVMQYFTAMLRALQTVAGIQGAQIFQPSPIPSSPPPSFQIARWALRGSTWRKTRRR